MEEKLSYRNEEQKDISYRKLAVMLNDKGGPATLDDSTRSIEVVGATENPVPMYDWQRGEMVSEILLMSGCQMPETRQMPLLDNHDRYSSSAVIGSFREMKTDKGQLTGRAFFQPPRKLKGYTRGSKRGTSRTSRRGTGYLRLNLSRRDRSRSYRGGALRGP